RVPEAGHDRFCRAPVPLPARLVIAMVKLQQIGPGSPQGPALPVMPPQQQKKVPGVVILAQVLAEALKRPVSFVPDERLGHDAAGQADSPRAQTEVRLLVNQEEA